MSVKHILDIPLIISILHYYVVFCNNVYWFYILTYLVNIGGFKL